MPAIPGTPKSPVVQNLINVFNAVAASPQHEAAPWHPQEKDRPSS